MTTPKRGLLKSPSRSLLLLAITALPFLVAAAFLILHPQMTPDQDSVSYLNWSPSRSSVYPLFLNAAAGPYLLHIQLFVYAAACAWLVFYVFRLFNDLALASLLSAGLIANPYVWILQGTILSEALSTPLFILFLSCVAGYVASRRPSLVLAASFLAGLVAATRPASLPLCAVPVLAVLLTRDGAWGRTFKLALLCVGVALAPLAADRLYSRSVHGEKMTSLAGKHAFAKSALLEAAPLNRTKLSPLERRLAQLVEVDFAPVRRQLRSVRGGTVYDVLRLNYETCIQYTCTNQAFSSFHVSEPVLNRAMLKVGLARLKQKPQAYFRIIWDEYRGLWVFHSRTHPELADAYNRFLMATPDMPFREAIGINAAIVPESEQKSVFRVSRPAFLMIGIAIASLMLGLGLLVLGGRRHPFLLISFLSAVTIEAVLVFTASLGVGIPRYTMSLWPAIVCALLFGFFYCLSLVLSRRRPDEAGSIRPRTASPPDRSMQAI